MNILGLRKGSPPPIPHVTIPTQKSGQENALSRLYSSVKNARIPPPSNARLHASQGRKDGRSAAGQIKEEKYWRDQIDGGIPVFLQAVSSKMVYEIRLYACKTCPVAVACILSKKASEEKTKGCIFCLSLIPPPSSHFLLPQRPRRVEKPQERS